MALSFFPISVHLPLFFSRCDYKDFFSSLLFERKLLWVYFHSVRYLTIQSFNINLGFVAPTPPSLPASHTHTHTNTPRLPLFLAIGHQSSQHRLLSLTGQLTTLRVKALINPWPSLSHTYTQVNTHKTYTNVFAIYIFGGVFFK